MISISFGKLISLFLKKMWTGFGCLKFPYNLHRRLSLFVMQIPIFAGFLAIDALAMEANGRTEGLPAVVQALEDWLPEQLIQANVPGAAAAVVDKQGLVWENSYGQFGYSDSRPVDPNTLFCVRSVSKSLTALAVLMAVQDGLVELDTPINTYLPEFRVNSRYDASPEQHITLRHLLSHQAGFAHDPPQFDESGDQNTFERHIRNIPKTWLRFPVGYRNEYANMDFDLAGYILQVRAGKPFAQYAKEKVLDPIGMTSSTFDLELAARQENRALGHHPDGSVAHVRLPEIPSGGLYSTIRDMAKYAQFHLNGGIVNGKQLLRKGLIEEFHSIQFPRSGQRTGYCLGLYREVCGTTYSIYHPGGGRGWRSLLIVYPELNAGVVILTNKIWHKITGSVGRSRLNGQVLKALGASSIPDHPNARKSRVPDADSRVQSILGRYGESPGIAIDFENGVLGARSASERFTRLTMYDEAGELVGLREDSTEIRFLPALGNQPGSVMIVDRLQSGSKVSYLEFNDSRTDPLGPDKVEWRKYVGEYYVLWDGQPWYPVSISMRNGYLYYGDAKCTEYEPGLFFTYSGNAIDFRPDPPTAANFQLMRKD